MGITAGALSRQIKHIERIAVHDDGAEPLDLYLIELTSVTVAATQALARSLRNSLVYSLVQPHRHSICRWTMDEVVWAGHRPSWWGMDGADQRLAYYRQ